LRRDPRAIAALDRLDLPTADSHGLPASEKRFADGGQYRIEIPSCEGPVAMQAVIDEAAARHVTVHRVSQGSGIMLQTDDEIRDMLALGRQHGIEVCLFVGPRAAWDTGIQASSSTGRVVGGSLRGADQLSYAIEDVLHGASLGLRSILVGDLNIAPREDDVWDHKKLLKIVSHTPVEVEHLAQAQDAGAWVDVTRQDIPSGLLYSWWSYRARDWAEADRGRRLDHIWATPDIATAAHSSRILRDARGWEQPSDHVPVFATFDL